MRSIINGAYLFFMKYMPKHSVKRNLRTNSKISNSELDILENEIVNKYISSELPDEKEVALFIKRYGLWNVFPYRLCFNYLWKAALLVRFDKKEKMYYVQRNGRKLYFKQNTLTETINYYNSILCEQDKNSPHFYDTENVSGGENGIFLDCGAAEGFLALDLIDKFEKIYVFEADREWVKALQKTFEPYGNKAEIIHGFLADKSKDEKISLDSFFNEKKIDTTKPIYIKMDVEGYESKVIEGAKETISNSTQLRMTICTYHKQNDAEKIVEQLKEFGISHIQYSKGYMILFYASDLEMPFLRKGMIHVEKHELQ